MPSKRETGEKGRLPDFHLKAYRRSTGESSKVGAAWVTEDGHIYIKLDVCVYLPADPDIALTLFKFEPDEAYKPRKSRKRSRAAGAPDGTPSDNEIPF